MGPQISVYHRERVCDKACLPARGSMKVTDIISQSDSQCLTPGYLSARNLTERRERSMRGFPLSPCYPSTTPSLHLVTCLSFAELLWWWVVHIVATQMLSHYNNLSRLFCSFFFLLCQYRAVFGLSELFPRALIGYWMLSFFLIKYFDHGHMYWAYVCVL